MGLSITGYVLEPTRVGRSNSPFTFTPDIIISSQAAFDTAYPSSEANPRTEYHVFVLTDGDFPDPEFCWTKNEILQRFGYDGRNQRFRTLPGGPLEIAGILETDSNTNRLSVTPPVSATVSSFPVRISLGTDSGTTFPVTVVADDVNFTTPAAGTVELAQSTGNLNWNPSDLTTFQGQTVRFQRQSFFAFDESVGRLGLIDEALLLNPLPASGQFPLVRIGFGEFLTPVQVASEGGFSADPTAGTVEWALTTGRLKFNSGDLAANPGKPVYYEGTCFGFALMVPTSSLGTVGSPGAIGANPDEDSGRFFRVPGVVQFAEVVYVDAFTLFGKRSQVEVRRSDGQVQFSLADQILYGSQTVQLVTPDLVIERGMSLRWFRNPVDPTNTDPDLKDVSALYVSVDATLANPIIESPQVFLPAVPVETQPITARVEQGTGSFTGVLPRLDVVSPPTGFGYVLDFEAQQFLFARRRVNVITPGSVRAPYGAVQLSDPLVQESNLVLELETAPGSGTFSPLTLDEDVTFNFDAGLATLVETDGELVASGSTGAFTSATAFSDTTADFVTAGVVQGDFLVVLSGTPQGVYTIDTVNSATSLTVDGGATVESNLLYEIRRGVEVLADRFFQEVQTLDPNTRVERLNSLGPATNSPRLSIDLAFIDESRFRFGSTTFATTVQVANDGAFTAPGSLAEGTVEVSQDTGNLNFSSADLGKTVFWARTLTFGTDYRLTPELGFVQLTERALENEEVVITYVAVDGDGNRTLVEERGTFLVRKELTEHPTPTAVIPFNPLGREVASVPPPRVFRGGRPQDFTKVSINVTASTITFLASDQVTDALPAGPPVDPVERVYVDYNIFGALGGEDSLTVLQPPMAGANISIEAETSSFQIAGDRTAAFPSNHLLKVDGSEVYLIGSSAFTPGGDPTDPGFTTVTLASPQEFRSDFTNPSLAVTSGQTRVSSFFLFPSYFVTELATFDTTPRGSNKFQIVGDVSRIYVTGTVVLWTDGGSILDFNVVEGSVFRPERNRTEIILAANGARQYTSGLITLRRSVRPILATAAADVSTSRSPDLSLPFQVFRRVEGSPGELLTSPEDYRIDDSGRVQFTDPLQANEELSIFYTGAVIIEDGRDFRASYTHLVAPSASNGLRGQILLLDYTTYAPDTVFWRVETMTNFRGELAQQFQDEAQASIPTGGPRLENTSGTPLFEEGNESLFFEEKRLRNEDLVARATLKYFNDGVNLLEDALQSMDGRVVGDHDGRFLFDGNIDNPVRNSVDDVTNQIDDLLQVAFRPTITFPPFAVTFGPVYQPMYKPSRFSRFFPTRRSLYSVAADPTGLETGDTILVTEFGNWSKVNQISRRLPWAVLTEPATLGDTVLTVDDADGAEDLLRPAFDSGTYTHRVAVVAQDGTVLVPESTPLDVSAAGATTITLGSPLLINIPVGATIYQVPLENPLAPSVMPFPKFYRENFDVGTNLQDGELTHIEPFPPFDGSVGGFPAELEIQNPPGGEVLDVFVWISNNLTTPDRVPALDGGTQDDDRNRQFPILSPAAESEFGSGVGFLRQERTIIESGGTLRTITTSPFIGTGSLNVTINRITLDSGTFPAPVPKVNNLVRILSGSNAGLSYRRVSATDGSTFVEVDLGDAWPTQESGISFLVTVASPLVTGTLTGTISPVTRLTDGTKNFIAAGVQVGHTVVVTNGVNLGLRRQVTAIISATELDVVAFPATQATVSYTVEDPLNTYGGAGSVLETLDNNLDGELRVLSTNTPPTEVYNQQDAIELFLDQFFTDIVVSATGQTTTGSPTLTDTSVNFVTAGVVPGHFVFVRSGTNAGVFRVETVTGPTTLDVDSANPFPDSSGGFSYRIVDSGGLIEQTLADLQSVLEDIDQAILDVAAFQTLINTTVSVLGDAGAFTNEILISDLDARVTEITARETQLDPNTGAPPTLSSVLSSGDRLYDRRFVWIDARTNLETGILPKKERAETNRLKAEQDLLKQLTKILSTRP